MGLKKGQYSIEYLMTAVVALMLITGSAYFFFQMKQSDDQQILEQRIQDVGNQLKKYTTESFYSTGAYKKTLKVDLPLEVTNIFAYEGKYIVFRTKNGMEYIFESDTPVFAKIDTNINSGKLIIQRVGATTVICSTDPCVCEPKEIPGVGGTCDNLMDDDCDGKIDGDDTDCCVDADGDGYTNQTSCNHPGVLSGDCHDDNSSINPGASERCDNIDWNCDGDTENSACKLSCYVEASADQDGNGQCAAGNTILLALSAPTHAHVQAPDPGNNYGYDLCCTEKAAEGVNFRCFVEMGQTCSSGEKLVGFDVDMGPNGGSHVENASINNYPDSLCCDASGSLACAARQTCNADEEAIMSISASQNAQVAPAGTTYATQICCKVTP